MQWTVFFFFFALSVNAHISEEPSSETQSFNPNAFNSFSPKSKEAILKKAASITDWDAQKASAFSTIPETLAGMRKMVDEISVDAPQEVLWENFSNSSPSEIWKGPRVQYAFSYSPGQKTFYYPGQKAPAFQIGQVIYNVLDFAGVKIMVGLTVNRINAAEHLIELAYLEGNTSKGAQVIQILKKDENHSVVKHTSYYKSESNFRDRAIYPIFHGMTTGEFYRQLKKRIATPTE
jgi:hypothetical protein